jgi:hypothetical protein
MTDGSAMLLTGIDGTTWPVQAASAPQACMQDWSCTMIHGTQRLHRRAPQVTPIVDYCTLENFHDAVR